MDGKLTTKARHALASARGVAPEPSSHEQVQEILRQLEPHSPSWVAILRSYIARLEAGDAEFNRIK